MQTSPCATLSIGPCCLVAAAGDNEHDDVQFNCFTKERHIACLCPGSLPHPIPVPVHAHIVLLLSCALLCSHSLSHLSASINLLFPSFRSVVMWPLFEWCSSTPFSTPVHLWWLIINRVKVHGREAWSSFCILFCIEFYLLSSVEVECERIFRFIRISLWQWGQNLGKGIAKDPNRVRICEGPKDWNRPE